MSKWTPIIKNKHIRCKEKGIQEVFKKEDGAIDLASIMVGVIVIGLIGGVIAATVFAVIPWTQDNAAKQQLDSIVQAENAYFGLSAAVPSPLPAGTIANSFGKSAELEAAKLLKSGQRYCVTTSDDDKSYTGFSQSASGTIWTINDKNSKPSVFAASIDTLPTDCKFITEGAATAPISPAPTETPYVDPTPTITSLTYQCDTAGGYAFIPMGSMTGKLSWSDGTNQTLNMQNGASKSLIAGQKYTLTFEGTYPNISVATGGNPCLRSVDHWGSASGVTTAAGAFINTPNLTSMPEHIPPTITNMDSMFKNATSLNTSNISKWDVANVTNMTRMFEGATSFNQPLNNWNVGKVTNMSFMFQNASNFNQPLNSWNVSNVTDMVFMFNRNNTFSQDLSTWDTTKVRSMAYMFGEPYTMKNNVNHVTYSTTTSLTYQCDTAGGYAFIPMGSMTGTSSWSDGTIAKLNMQNGASKSLIAGQKYTLTFEGTYPNISVATGGNTCLRSVDHWGSASGVTTAAGAFLNTPNLVSVPDQIPTTINNMDSMFKNATALNDDSVGKWDVANVTNMTRMFEGATSYNQPLNNWNVGKVTNMSFMFQNAFNFNQPLNSWNVSNVTDMVFMFNQDNDFTQDLSAWNTNKVKSMAYMFGEPYTMKNNVNHVTYSTTTSLTYQCDTNGLAFVPMGSMTGTLSWNDGTIAKLNMQNGASKSLIAGQKYTLTFEGTYPNISVATGGNPCLRSVDHWGSASGVTTAAGAFINTPNLVSVPDQIPTTITNMSSMFKNSTSFNNANVKNWDVSKVSNMSSMFAGATAFNQDLSGWNTTAVTNGTLFAPTSFPDAYMPSKTSK